MRAAIAILLLLFPALARGEVRPVIGVEAGFTVGAHTLLGATASARAGVRLGSGRWSFAPVVEGAATKFTGVGPYTGGASAHVAVVGEGAVALNRDGARLHLYAGGGNAWLGQPSTDHQSGYEASVPVFVAGTAVSYRAFRANLEVRHHLELLDHEKSGNPQVQVTFGYLWW